MFQNYLRAASRNCWKHRAVTILNIAGLSAGMTAAILIFLWVQNETSYDSYQPGADRIYRITSTISRIHRKWATAPLPLADAIRTELPQVEKTSVIRSSYSTWFHVGDDFFEEKHAAYIGRDWFDLVHYDFVEGDAASLMAHPFSLALTESKAKQYFGNRPAVGQTINIDTATYEVRAVIKDNPSNSSFQYDVLMPLNSWLDNPLIRPGEMAYDNYNYSMFLRLRQGVDPKQTAQRISTIINSHQKQAGTIIDLEPLRDMHFESDIAHGSADAIDPKTVYIFSALGIFLLVIACINYVNLTTARASLRAKEVGIRKIVGAGKKGLFVQFMLESLLISIISLGITIVLVRLSLPLFDNLTGKTFANPLTSPVLWKIVAITLLAATMLNGVYPAVFLSSFNPLNVFRGASILRFRDVSLRKGLVILQFTFSIMLIIGTIIIQRQLNYIQTTNPGYDRAQVFSFRLPWTTFVGKPAGTKAATYAGILHDLASQTSISDVCMASESIVNLRSSTVNADWEGHDTSYKPVINQLSADDNYRQFFHIQLAAGRWFEPANPADGHNFILNETAVADFKMHKPVLGQRFVFQRDTGTIIGVVKDFHFTSMHTSIAPMVIFNRDDWRSTFFVKARPGQASRALAAARTLMRSYNPGHPFMYSFMDEEFENLYRADQRLSALILTFSVIAIAISCMGLFALSAFNARQRIREIGIRKVLGAGVSNILLLLSRDFIRLVLISIGIATPVAGWMMYRWLQDFAYRIPLGPGVFIVAGILAVVIAVVTISAQSIRAALANPVKNLRTE